MKKIRVDLNEKDIELLLYLKDHNPIQYTQLVNYIVNKYKVSRTAAYKKIKKLQEKNFIQIIEDPLDNKNKIVKLNDNIRYALDFASIITELEPLSIIFISFVVYVLFTLDFSVVLYTLLTSILYIIYIFYKIYKKKQKYVIVSLTE